MEDLAVLCRGCHDVVREIEDLADGGDVMGMTPRVLTMLATIDRRIAIPIPLEVKPSAPKPSVDGPQTIGEVNAILERKRAELGIVLKDLGA